MAPDIRPGLSGPPIEAPISGADALALLESDTTLEAAQPILALAAEYLTETRSGEGPVSTWHSAEVIADRLAAPLPRRARPLADVARRLSSLLLQDVNRLAHPMYIGHQVSAPLPAAVWTDAVVSAFNQSMAVREMSPSFTPLEHQVIEWMTDLVGWDARAGGTMTSGGTEATFTALLAARARVLPNAWRDGVGANPPVLVCGEHAHYAVSRAAGEMGLGLANVVVVPSADHRLSVAALRERLSALRAEGRRVMAVVATAGCTSTGTFDDLNAVADACDECADELGPLWLHVDAAHGGAAMLSAAHKHRVAGLARARSVAWDPHKTLLLPLAAGLLLMREEHDLERAFAQQAPYLFNANLDAKAWDMGPRSFQCSRRADVLKVWVAFERYGADALAALYERLCAMAVHLHGRLATHAQFTPLHVPESNILCFAWNPPGADAADRDALTDALRERYNRSGRGWITATTLDGRRVLRVTVMNPRTDLAQLAALVEGLVAEGTQVIRHHR
ncbi:MAG: pyridoxal phosphate-dependent decarboxylase family protein [Gemmatimonas sp.]|jgi:L-2,4-diaminobutyrate decarboxylase|uniref:pyridoxal phosphate-dependent decarboxylase family protein n=1 Tax=Gemmatimonas sp. TaxID=1962908 RepID=UPI00391F0A72